MGMTPHQYWEESPYLTVAYRKAYKLKLQAQNEQAWLQGAYFYNAVAVCLQNVLARKGQKKIDYLDKPIDIFPPTEAEKKRREQIEYAKMRKAMEAMQRQQRKKNAKGG